MSQALPDDSLDLGVLSLLVDAAPVMLWMTGPDARCTFVNKTLLDFVGQSQEQQLEHGWFAAVHPDDVDRCVSACVPPATSTQPPCTVEYRLRRADGEYRWVLARGVPRFDAGGTFLGYVGSCVDITDTLLTQERVRASEAQLRSLAARLQSAREEERSAVSRELHDELGQALTSLKYELTRTIKELLKAGLPRTLVDRMQSLIGVVEVATNSVRRIATELRPPALDHFGLAAAIELDAAATQRRTGLRCRVSCFRKTTRLDSDQLTTVFRVFQEALTNVVRHANASAVRIRLREDRRTFTMEIQDNGRGITEQELTDSGSIGLLGMRERAHLLGGNIEIDGSRGKGTKMVARFPLRGREARPTGRRARSRAS